MTNSQSGSPPSAEVFLLHSAGLSGRQWQKLVGALDRSGMRADAVDLTGHGRSEPWPEPKPFDFHDDVARVVGLVERAGKAMLVGHSYGGLVALHVARRVPERVGALAVYDPVAFATLSKGADDDAIADVAGIDLRWGTSEGDRERWLEAFVEYWSGPGSWGALREEARAEFRRVAWVVHEGVRSLMADTTPAAAFAVVACPVLLVSGERSPIAAGRVIRKLGEAISGARTLVIPGAGHMGPLSHADALNRAVTEHLVAAAGPPNAAPSWSAP